MVPPTQSYYNSFVTQILKFPLEENKKWVQVFKNFPLNTPCENFVHKIR